MRFKLALLLAAFPILPPCATLGAERAAETERYVIQVASFSDSAQAQQFVSRLRNLGELATSAVVDLAARGIWTRVFVGHFASAVAARAHAECLVRSGLIVEFLIKPAGESLKAPGLINQKARSSVSTNPAGIFSSQIRAPAGPTPLSLPRNTRNDTSLADARLRGWASDIRSVAARSDERLLTRGPLPVARRLSPMLTSGADPWIKPDPARLAFTLIAGDTQSLAVAERGGLWVTGDAAEGLVRLQWIAGASAVDLISLERDGRVKLDPRLLARAARVQEVPQIEAPLAITNYICSNEGLLLLVQLTQAKHRYRLHIARQAPTRGAEVEVTGGINLDNNFDSRINPYRRSGKKMDNESPPDGFDSLVAINPVALWFNQLTNQVVPAGHILFHEMAEAHAKLELGLDYLGDAVRPGAHDVALERERRLKSQRPLYGVVLTAGSNRLLRSEEEVRQFFSQPPGRRQ